MLDVGISVRYYSVTFCFSLSLIQAFVSKGLTSRAFTIIPAPSPFVTVGLTLIYDPPLGHRIFLFFPLFSFLPSFKGLPSPLR